MTELNRWSESTGKYQSELAEILAAYAARASGSPGLVNYFYEKLFEKLILGISIAGGIFSAVQKFSAPPVIEDPWMNFGAKVVATGVAGVEGAGAGATISLLSGLAGSIAVLHWKDLARFTKLRRS